MALDQGDVRFKPKKYDLNMKNRESPPAKPSIEKAPKLELKPLPHHLRYVFFGKSDNLPAFIASDFNMHQVGSLVKLLKGFKIAIGWTIADIIGIPSRIFSHKIQRMPNHKGNIEHQ